MKLGLAFAAAIVLVWVAPATATATGPGVSDLPKALADPVETSFVEVSPGTERAVEGYFDAQIFADNTGTNASERSDIADELRAADFVTGYGREFYMVGRSDWLYELAMVFRQPSGAQSVLATNKVDYARSPNSGSFITVRLNSSAFAVHDIVSGFHWTVIQFVKSNDLFAIARGSQDDFTTAPALAQARKAYDVAPAGTTLAAPAVVPPAYMKYLRPLEIAAFVGALVVAAALMAVVFLVFRPKPQPQNLEQRT